MQKGIAKAIAAGFLITSIMSSCSPAYLAKKKTELERKPIPALMQTSTICKRIGKDEMKLLENDSSGVLKNDPIMQTSSGKAVLLDYGRNRLLLGKNEARKRAELSIQKIEMANKVMQAEFDTLVKKYPEEGYRLPFLVHSFETAMYECRYSYRIVLTFARGLGKGKDHMDCNLTALLFSDFCARNGVSTVIVAGADKTNPLKIGHALVGIKEKGGAIGKFVDTFILLYSKGDKKPSIGRYLSAINDDRRGLQGYILGEKKDSAALAGDSAEYTRILQVLQKMRSDGDTLGYGYELWADDVDLSRLIVNSEAWELKQDRNMINYYKATLADDAAWLEGNCWIESLDKWISTYKVVKGYTFYCMEPEEYLKVYAGIHYLKIFLGWNGYKYDCNFNF